MAVAGAFIPQLLKTTGRCLLSRGIICVSGPDAPKLLNGLCTANVLEWPNLDRSGAYVGFLTPQGRFQYDSFIMRHEDTFLLDCDERVVGDFIFYLRQYKLRSKIDIQDHSSLWSVMATWNQNNQQPLPSLGSSANPDHHHQHPLSIADTRCPWTMSRSFLPKKDALSISTDTTLYNIFRMMNGIPEGPSEIPRGKAIPLEYNLDLMGGIDVQKGCYMGQELVTRTLHRGVIRKRTIPIRLYEPTASLKDDHDFTIDPYKCFPGVETDAELMPIQPAPQINSINDVIEIEVKKAFGKIIAIYGNVGIALARLPEIPANGLFAIHRPHPSASGTFILGRAEIPSWWSQHAH